LRGGFEGIEKPTKQSPYVLDVGHNLYRCAQSPFQDSYPEPVQFLCFAQSLTWME